MSENHLFAEASKWKALAGELLVALEDISDHSGIPNFNTVQWSNYCHEIAFDAVAKAREAGLK